MPAGGEELLDLLGVQREDRVAQLGDDESDETAGGLVKALRALVAEEVEGHEHLAPGRLGDVRLAVEHA